MSSYELNAHKKSDTVKWVIAFTLIFVLILGMAASIYIGLDNRQEEEAPATEGSTAPALQANTVSEAGIQLVAAKTYASTSAVPAAAAASESVTVTATLTADGSGYDDTIVWTVAFQNPNSSWASGKNVADYVTKTVSSDTHSVLIDCDAPFGEPIILTATSVDNSECTASCQLDYVKRVTNVTDFYFNDGSYKNYVRIGMDNTVTAQVEYGVGTVTPQVQIESVSLYFTSELQTLIRNNVSTGMIARPDITTVISDSTVTGNVVSGSFGVDVNSFYSGNGNGNDRQLNNALYRAAYVAATGVGESTCKAMPMAILTVSYEGVEYQVYDYAGDTYALFERGALEQIISVTDLEVDPKSFAF